MFRIILPAKDLPPDEKPYEFIHVGNPTAKVKLNPKCKGQFQKSTSSSHNEMRYLELHDDEDIQKGGKSIHRSNEEFCITIGKHIRKSTIKKSISELEEFHDEAEIYFAPEEGTFIFFIECNK